MTIHIVIQNNESTIEKTLESLIPLKSKILIANLGCSDETLNKCRLYDAEIISLSLNDDRSEVRNQMLKLSKTNWNFYIDPWELILNGHDHILSVLECDPAAYNATIIQGDVLTQQIRLWHKKMNLKFINPVFEIIKSEGETLPIYIKSGSHNNAKGILELAKKWNEKSAIKTEPIYYMACASLINNNWDSFLNFSHLYLHQEKNEITSVFMIHYYSAMVNCYIKKNYQSSIKSLLICLAKKPTMAEFWCLLADVYYDLKDYEKAKCFYENAIILGERRLQNDGWLIEVSKYKTYPQKMINACDQIQSSFKYYFKK